jgi:hypothetical protein
MSDNELYIRLKTVGIETLGDLQARIKQLKAEVQGAALASSELTSKQAELKQMQGVYKELTGSVGGLHSTYFKLGTLIREVTVAMGAAVAIGYTFKKIFDIGEKSARMEMLRSTLQQIASKDGVDFDRVMSDIEKRIPGMVNDFDKLQGVMKLSLLDVGWSKVPEIMELAEKRSKLIGRSFNETLEILERAAMGGKRAMKQLLIPVDVDETTRNYAKSLGVMKDELSETGKQHAIFNAILDKAKTQHLDISAAADAQLDKYEKLKTAWDNLTLSIGDLATVLTPLLTEITKVINAIMRLTKGDFSIFSSDPRKRHPEAYQNEPTNVPEGYMLWEGWVIPDPNYKKGKKGGGKGGGKGSSDVGGEIDQEKVDKRLNEEAKKRLDNYEKLWLERQQQEVWLTEQELKDIKKTEKAYQKYLFDPILNGIDNVGMAWEEQLHKNLLASFREGKTVADQFFIGLIEGINRVFMELVAKSIITGILNLLTGGIFGGAASMGGAAAGAGAAGAINPSVFSPPIVQVVPIATYDGLAVKITMANNQMNGRTI